MIQVFLYWTWFTDLLYKKLITKYNTNHTRLNIKNQHYKIMSLTVLKIYIGQGEETFIDQN